MYWIANLWDSLPYNQLHRHRSLLNMDINIGHQLVRMLKYDTSICTHKNELQLTGIPHCL